MNFPVEDAMDDAEAEVEHEAAVRLAGEGSTRYDAIDLELEAWRLDGLPEQGQEFVESTRQLVGPKDVLAGLEREVPILRFDLALEDFTELELGRYGGAVERVVEGRLHVGVEGRTHGHRWLLGQPWGRVFGQVAQVELLRVLFP